jgi:hypothetical protein
MIKRSYPYPIATSADSLEYLLGESGGALMQFPTAATTQFDDANNNSVTNLVVQHTTSGTPAAGIGAGVAFTVETAANNNEIGATIEAVSTDVTAGSEDFDLRLSTMEAGAAVAERLRIDSEGEIVTGGVARQAFATGGIGAADQHGIQLNKSTGQALLNLATWWAGVDAGASRIAFSRSNSNTIGGQTVVAVDERLGTISFAGSDGTALIEALKIEAFVDTTPGTDDMGGRYVLSITADGAAAPTERMRVNSDGQAIYTPGSTTPATLATNGNFTLTPTSNTNMRISYRGSDGVTRVANIALA